MSQRYIVSFDSMPVLLFLRERRSQLRKRLASFVCAVCVALLWSAALSPLSPLRPLHAASFQPCRVPTADRSRPADSTDPRSRAPVRVHSSYGLVWPNDILCRSLPFPRSAVPLTAAARQARSMRMPAAASEQRAVANHSVTAHPRRGAREQTADDANDACTHTHQPEGDVSSAPAQATRRIRPPQHDASKAKRRRRARNNPQEGANCWPNEQRHATHRRSKETLE